MTNPMPGQPLPASFAQAVSSARLLPSDIDKDYGPKDYTRFINHARKWGIGTAEIIEVLERGARKYPTDGIIFSAVGSMYGELAKTYYGISKLHPERKDFYLNKTSETREMALTWFEHADEMIPNDTLHLSEYAWCLLKAGDSISSEKIHSRIYYIDLERGETNEKHLTNLGNCHLEYTFYFEHEKHRDPELREEKLRLARACYGVAYLLDRSEKSLEKLQNTHYRLTGDMLLIRAPEALESDFADAITYQFGEVIERLENIKNGRPAFQSLPSTVNLYQ